MNHEARDKAADAYEKEFHEFYPDGMTVAPYCNSEVPSVAFSAGYDAGHAAAWNEIGAYAQQMGLSPEWVSLCREKATRARVT